MKICLIGAALCVAPIFSSTDSNRATGWLNKLEIVSPAHAQQADLILELQALRAEIGELRDMIERQQFEMRRMKRTVDSLSTQQTTSYSPPTRPAQAANQPSATAYQQGTQPSAVYPNATGAADSSAAGVYDDQPAPVLSDSERDFYRPYNADTATSPAVVNDGAGVSTAAEYDQRQLEAARAARSGQPPVIDRSVRVVPNQANQAPVLVNRPNVDGTATQLPTQRTVTVLEQGNSGNVPLPAGQAPQQVGLPNSNVNSQASVSVPATSSPQPASTQAQGGINGVALPDPTTAEPVVVSEQDYYQRGFELLKQSKHSQAVDVFKQQINQYPTGDFSDDAHYWIAESMYVNRSLDQSKLYFKAIIDRFAQSPRLPDAMLKTAYIEQEQGNQIEARILLQEIIQYHPRSNAAISAKNRLAELNG